MKDDQQPREVLIAEDDAQISRMVGSVIAREGLRVVTAATGEDALLHLRGSDYAAIVLDLMLPQVSGFEIIDDLRKVKPEHLKRVVVMTASPRHVRFLDETEVSGVLIKPFDINELRKLVRLAVEHSRNGH